MLEILGLSARRQAALIRERRISSVELVQAHLDWIARVNPSIHAAVDVLAERALAMAAATDEAIARGQVAGPLAGVPFSVKDSIEVEGTRCTAGTFGRRNAAKSPCDAEVVRRLRQAGGIPTAKTNLPDLLFAFETDNLIHGATRNPYGLARTCGGSSGGEAALIAACGSPCGLGSDAAGSVRLPAAFCGIAAIKPTSGRLPRTGHFPPAGGWIEALWQIGPMARRAEDLPLLMELLAGADGTDQTVIDVPFRDPALVNLADLRVAFYTAGAPAETVRRAAAALEPEVRSMEESRPGCLEEAYDLEMKLLGADGGDSLREFLISIGSTEMHPLLLGWLNKLDKHRTNVDGFIRYWAAWERYRANMFAFLRTHDVILCPAYPEPALPLGTSLSDANFRGFAHTMAYNLTGWPAGVVRCGESAEGLPIAVQVVAGPFREDIVLAVIERLEEFFGGWKPPVPPGPEFTSRRPGR